MDAIAAAARSKRSLEQLRPLEMSSMARAYWYLAYDYDFWSDFVLQHVDGMREEGSLWTGELSTHHKLGQTRSGGSMWKTSVDVPGVTDRLFWGQIIAFHATKGFGFIECDEIKKKYHKDLLLDKGDIKGFKTRDMVCFRVVITNRGWPQAVDLSAPKRGPVRFMNQLLLDEKDFEKARYVVHTMRYPPPGARSPQVGDRVCIAYKGRLIGKTDVFDSAEEFEFALGEGAAIAGWEKGVLDMKEGEDARLLLHWSLAYGIRGEKRFSIPPFSSLDYSLGILSVYPAGEPRPADAASRRVPSFSAEGRAEDEELRAVLYDPGKNRPQAASSSQPDPQADVAREGPEGDSAQDGAGACSGPAAALARLVEGVSMQAWLLSVDRDGALLQYHDKLRQRFDDAEQLVKVYAKVNGTDGTLSIEPAFFEDFSIVKAAYKRLFQNWFENTV